MAPVIPMTPIPEVSGVKDLLTLLEFLNNKSAVAKELKRLEEARKSANAVIAKLGKASEIENLWAKAEAAKTDAEELLRQGAATRTAAKAQAQQIVDAAKAGVMAKQNELENRERALAMNQQLLQEAVAAHEEASVKREQTAEARDEAQNTRADELVEQQSDLGIRETELQNQWAKLKAAMP